MALFWSTHLFSHYQNDSRQVGQMVLCVHSVLLEVYICKETVGQLARLVPVLLLALFSVVKVAVECMRTNKGQNRTCSLLVSKPLGNPRKLLSLHLTMQRILRKPGHIQLQSSITVHLLRLLPSPQIVKYQ